MSSTVSGRVLQVLATEGAHVKAGQALLRLESDELRAALAQAQANERQAQARIKGLRTTGRSVAAASQAQAESVLKAAEAELQRAKELIAQGFVSSARLDEVQRAFSVAQAQLSGARAQTAGLADQGSEITQAEAQLTMAQAAREAALARLNQTVLTAPADAQVLMRSVEPGRTVQPGNPLFTLALQGPRQLVAQVDERYLEQLQVGQVTSVVADAFPSRTFGARVLSIAPLVNGARGAVEVKFSMDPPAPDFLREDMTVSVEVETARRDKTMVIPIAALRGEDEQGQSQVLVIESGRVAQRLLKLGLRTLEAAEVLQGLSEGEQVLIGAAPEIGDRVRAVLNEKAIFTTTKALGASKDNAGSAMSNAIGR
jgi:HlyD family secretion protein